MIGEIILGAVICGTVVYIHKVGLPTVVREIQSAKAEIAAAIRAHANATAPIGPTALQMARDRAALNPIPLARAENVTVQKPKESDLAPPSV